MRASFSNLCLALGVGLVSIVMLPLAAEAGGLRATVHLTQHKVPKAGTEKSLLGFVRSHTAKRLVETQEPNIDDRKYLATMVTQFNQPPGDLEFHVLFYDVEDGSRQFIEDMSTFIDDRKQKTFVQDIKLPRKRFKPNRRMELVVTVKRAEVGALKFEVLGERKQHSGVVDFGDGT